MDETEEAARLAKYRRDELTKRQRLEDEERYGPLADRRRGLMQVTTALLMDHLGRFPLPRMSRVVGMRGDLGSDVYELVVESPDIPPPAEDGTLPYLDLDAKLHSISLDRTVPCMSIVQYVATAEWKDQPETRAATSMFDALGSQEKHRARLLEEADRAADGTAIGEFSPALEAVRKVGWVNCQPSDVKSWPEAVATLDEAQARELLATMLRSFWGEWK
jgi:hypothetical protein